MFSSEGIQAFIEIAPDAVIVVGAEGRIVLVNRQTEVTFGYTRAELLGMSIELLVPDALRSHHAGHRQHYVATPHTRPMGLGLRLYGRHKDGHEIPVEISLSPSTVDGALYIISIIRDVTQQQALEEAARRSDRAAAERVRLAEQRLQLLQRIIDAMPSAVYVVRGPEARLALANDATAQFWGAPWPIGQPMLAFLSEYGIQIFQMDGRPMEIWQMATSARCKKASRFRWSKRSFSSAMGTGCRCCCTRCR